MRCWIKFGTILFLAVFLCGHARAYDVNDSIVQMESAVPGESRQLLSGISIDSDDTLFAQFMRIWKNAAEGIRTSWLAGIKTIAKVIVIVLICGAAEGMYAAGGGEKELKVISMAGILSIASAVLADMNGLMAICRETLQSMSVFSKTLLPVMSAAVSISGAPGRAAAMQAITMFSLDLVIRMITEVLMPAVCLYLSIMTVNYALGQNVLNKAGEFVLWLVQTVLKASLTLFVSYLTISGVFSGSTDSIALKTAKAALSGAVPVVGGVISDATESLLAGAAAIRSLTGVFGVICLIAICLIPFVKMGINYLLFKGGAAILSILCSKELTGYLSALCDSFGVMLGMLGTCAAILFFEIVFSIVLIGG